VTSGLAGMKFSTSPMINGSIKVMEVRVKVRNSIPSRSLMEKNGWNGILSRLEFTPIGLFDPVWCRNIK